MRLPALAAIMLAGLPGTAVLACSCEFSGPVTPAQRRAALSEFALVGRGRVIAVERPWACTVAPIRWSANMLKDVIGRTYPVTYRVRLREVLWGKPVATVAVVQHQHISWSGCEADGEIACQPPLPLGDALWVIRRAPDGELRDAGLCGQGLARAALGLEGFGTE